MFRPKYKSANVFSDPKNINNDVITTVPKLFTNFPNTSL